MNIVDSRQRRARKTRAKIAELKATRLCVHRTNTHIYAQIIAETGDKVLASASSPITSAVSTLTTLVAESILKLCANSNDHQLGLLLTSFDRQEHYPFGKRDAQNVPDATGNMKVDYTIFGF